MIDSGNDALMSGLKQSTNPESAKNRPVGTPWQSVTVLPLSRRLNPLILNAGLLPRFLTRARQSERDLPAATFRISGRIRALCIGYIIETSRILMNRCPRGYSSQVKPDRLANSRGSNTPI